VDINPNMFSPLNVTECSESFPSRIWYSLIEWKDNLEKLLNDTCQYQSERKSVNLKC